MFNEDQPVYFDLIRNSVQYKGIDSIDEDLLIKILESAEQRDKIVHQLHQYDMSTFMIAIQWNRLRLAQKLLDLGADVNAVRAGDGRTALFFADSIEAIQMLLDLGLDKNAKDIDGKMALDIFMEDNKPELARYIEQH
jgi:ankyrin repeat protein